MKKEVTLVITVCLFLLAYVLDYFAGSINLGLINPMDFLNQTYFKLYPMTFVAVIIRSVAITLSTTLVLSIMERQFFKKMIISLFLGFVAEIYAFQILATGAKVTPTLWTLAISYGGALLIIPIAFYIFASIADFLIPQRKNVTHLPTSQSNDSSSVLNP